MIVFVGTIVDNIDINNVEINMIQNIEKSKVAGTSVSYTHLRAHET